MVNSGSRAFSIFALLVLATLVNSRPAISQESKVESPTTTTRTVEASPQPACTPPGETGASSIVPASVATGDTRPKIFAEPDAVFSKTPPALSTAEQTGGGNNNGTQANAARVPLTSGEKMERAFRASFLSPAGYIRTGISAAITEATEEDQPHKTTEDRVADGMSRFAINFSTRATRILLGSGVYPSLFKQDPRYRPSDKKELGARTLHAISRVFVTDGDSGRSQPNYSRLAGNLSASALANIWERDTPGRDRIGARPTFRRFGLSIGFDAINNIIFQEFWPDIMRALGRK